MQCSLKNKYDFEHVVVQENTFNKCRTHNERFGVMAAVTPQTILYRFERLSPAVSVVEAATTPSRRTLHASGQTARWTMKRENEC